MQLKSITLNDTKRIQQNKKHKRDWKIVRTADKKLKTLKWQAKYYNVLDKTIQSQSSYKLLS